MAEMRGTLLVIDDESAIRTVLSRSLSRSYDVTVAQNGRSALTILEAGQRFDVIVCDWMMPEMCGERFVAALRELDPGQAQRLIVMTGDPVAVERAEVSQFVLEKPFLPSDLRALLDRIRNASDHGYFPTTG